MRNCLLSLRLPARCVWPEFHSSRRVGLLFMSLSAVRLIVNNFRQGREVVKGDRRIMVCESLMMCGDVGGNVIEARMIVRRSVSIIEDQVSRLFLNLSETRMFYGAGVLSGSGVSPESALHSRATHNCRGSSTKARCCQDVSFH